MSIHFAPQIIPADAPFIDAQRAWLNRFFAEALLRDLPPRRTGRARRRREEDDSTPWKDPAMAIEDRMVLAAERPVRWKLMAAMAQQDCGQCGYNCADYSQAIFEQAEPRLNLCAPGGKATARMLKSLVEEMGGGVIDPEEVAAKAAAAPQGRDRRAAAAIRATHPVAARFVSRTRLNGEGSEKLHLPHRDRSERVPGSNTRSATASACSRTTIRRSPMRSSRRSTCRRTFRSPASRSGRC